MIGLAKQPSATSFESVQTSGAAVLPDLQTYRWILGVWLALAPVVFVALCFITIPYARYRRAGWGPEMPHRWGWILMEAPAPLVFAALFAVGPHHHSAAAWIFLAIWEIQYVHRSFIFPFRTRGDDRRTMPIFIAAVAFMFNGTNAYLNARWLYAHSGGYTADWLMDARFVAGVAVFATGFAVNRWADYRLRNLRAPGETAYRIPHGGLYRWVSCPNYLGEIVMWAGWALATWSWAGVAFTVWTVANLAPRAHAHHRWYHQTFADYPPERRALLPGIW